MGVALLSSKLQIRHCNGLYYIRIQLYNINISLYKKNGSERRLSSVYNILLSVFDDIIVNEVINFNTRH